MSNEALATAIADACIAVTVRVDTKYMPDEQWDERAHHYKVTFERYVAALDTFYDVAETRKVTFPFHTGSAHTTEPTAADVMECLLSDAATLTDITSFEDWANELGYDTDSRKAERAYKAVVRQGERLAYLLGDDLLETWMHSEEIAEF